MRPSSQRQVRLTNSTRECHAVFDTIVSQKMDELAERHHGDIGSVSQREIDSITFYSHDRMYYMRFNELHPEFGEILEFPKESITLLLRKLGSPPKEHRRNTP